jgi:hypothetical protein
MDECLIDVSAPAPPARSGSVRRPRADGVPRAVPPVRAVRAAQAELVAEPPVPVRANADQLSALFAQSEQIEALIADAGRAIVDPSGGGVRTALEALDAARRGVVSLVRRTASVHEACAVDVACMRQTLDEATTDLAAEAAGIIERQYVLHDNGRPGEASALAKSIVAMRTVRASLATLHPDPMHAHPAAVRVNGAMLSIAQRMATGPSE